MHLHMVCFLICRWFRLVVRFVCAVVFLLLATHTQLSANTMNPSENDTHLHVPAFAIIPASDEYDADNLHMGIRSKEALSGTAVFMNISSGHAGTIAVPSTTNAADESASSAIVAENRIPDWDGVWRDTGILFGSQFVAAGLIYIMPESVSSWSSEQKKNGFKSYAQNVVNPVVDQDQFYINYVLHPYWGAAYYIRARERGLDKIPSFMYSTLISAMYEFGVECFFERPSIQDLVVTPVVGSLLGALIFEPWRESIKRKQDLRWYDHAVLVVTDPVGLLSQGIEKKFGIKSTIMVDYSVPRTQKRSAGSANASNSNRIGVVVQFPFN